MLTTNISIEKTIVLVVSTETIEELLFMISNNKVIGEIYLQLDV